MAKGAARPTPRALSLLSSVLHDWSHFRLLLACILVGEAILGTLIILRVAYTEIDWIAYMQEVEGFLDGERNYYNLKGQTGPLPYPAGFLYVFAALRSLTAQGTDIQLAQFIFLGLYLANLGVVAHIYERARITPPWALVLLCLSKRVHSIFVLRLFNDPVCLFFVYVSIALFCARKWRWGCLWFSLAVSVKMNALLFAPALFLLLCEEFMPMGVVAMLSICAGVQVVLALPFVTTFPLAYLDRAFDFRRAFLHVWTVNLKFIPKEHFTDKRISAALLLLHVVTLGLLFVRAVWQRYHPKSRAKRVQHPTMWRARTVALLFVANFVGIAFSRSLHYQFYSWYFHTLPLLLWLTPLPSWARVGWMLVVEVQWNVFPATVGSSLVLTAAHGVLLALLVRYLPTSRHLLS